MAFSCAFAVLSIQLFTKFDQKHGVLWPLPNEGLSAFVINASTAVSLNMSDSSGGTTERFNDAATNLAAIPNLDRQILPNSTMEYILE